MRARRALAWSRARLGSALLCVCAQLAEDQRVCAAWLGRAAAQAVHKSPAGHGESGPLHRVEGGRQGGQGVCLAHTRVKHSLAAHTRAAARSRQCDSLPPAPRPIRTAADGAAHTRAMAPRSLLNLSCALRVFAGGGVRASTQPGRRPAGDRAWARRGAAHSRGAAGRGATAVATALSLCNAVLAYWLAMRISGCIPQGLQDVELMRWCQARPSLLAPSACVPASGERTAYIAGWLNKHSRMARTCLSVHHSEVMHATHTHDCLTRPTRLHEIHTRA